MFKPFSRPPRIRRLANLGDEAVFLAGRSSRWKEFTRVIRISLEFIRGFRTLHFIGPAITVFGSARFKEGNSYYDLARKIEAISEAVLITK